MEPQLRRSLALAERAARRGVGERRTSRRTAGPDRRAFRPGSRSPMRPGVADIPGSRSPTTTCGPCSRRWGYRAPDRLHPRLRDAPCRSEAVLAGSMPARSSADGLVAEDGRGAPTPRQLVALHPQTPVRPLGRRAARGPDHPPNSKLYQRDRTALMWRSTPIRPRYLGRSSLSGCCSPGGRHRNSSAGRIDAMDEMAATATNFAC